MNGTDNITAMAYGLTGTFSPVLLGEFPQHDQLRSLTLLLAREITGHVGFSMALSPRLPAVRLYTMSYFISRTKLLIRELITQYGQSVGQDVVRRRYGLYATIVGAHLSAGLITIERRNELLLMYSEVLDLTRSMMRVAGKGNRPDSKHDGTAKGGRWLELLARQAYRLNNENDRQV